jgi:hypothetical protein
MKMTRSMKMVIEANQMITKKRINQKIRNTERKMIIIRRKKSLMNS